MAMAMAASSHPQPPLTPSSTSPTPSWVDILARFVHPEPSAAAEGDGDAPLLEEFLEALVAFLDGEVAALERAVGGVEGEQQQQQQQADAQASDGMNQHERAYAASENMQCALDYATPALQDRLSHLSLSGSGTETDASALLWEMVQRIMLHEILNCWSQEKRLTTVAALVPLLCLDRAGAFFTACTHLAQEQSRLQGDFRSWRRCCGIFGAIGCVLRNFRRGESPEGPQHKVLLTFGSVRVQALPPWVGQPLVLESVFLGLVHEKGAVRKAAQNAAQALISTLSSSATTTALFDSILHHLQSSSLQAFAKEGLISEASHLILSLPTYVICERWDSWLAALRSGLQDEASTVRQVASQALRDVAYHQSDVIDGGNEGLTPFLLPALEALLHWWEDWREIWEGEEGVLLAADAILKEALSVHLRQLAVPAHSRSQPLLSVDRPDREKFCAIFSAILGNIQNMLLREGSQPLRFELRRIGIQVLPKLGRLLAWFDPPSLLGAWCRAEASAPSPFVNTASELTRASALHVRHAVEIASAEALRPWGRSSEGISDSSCDQDTSALLASVPRDELCGMVRRFMASTAQIALAAGRTLRISLAQGVVFTSGIESAILMLCLCFEGEIDRSFSPSQMEEANEAVVTNLLELHAKSYAGMRWSGDEDEHEHEHEGRAQQRADEFSLGTPTMSFPLPHCCGSHSLAVSPPTTPRKKGKCADPVALQLDRRLGAGLLRCLPSYCAKLQGSAALQFTRILEVWLEYSDDDIRWMPASTSEALFLLLAALHALLRASGLPDGASHFEPAVCAILERASGYSSASAQGKQHQLQQPQCEEDAERWDDWDSDEEEVEGLSQSEKVQVLSAIRLYLLAHQTLPLVGRGADPV